jgi:hypothetical protein
MNRNERAARDRRLVRRYERNILKVYEKASAEDLLAGARWYADARAWCATVAAEYALSTREVAAVVAALSPRNPWKRNLVDARTLIEAYRGGAEVHEVRVGGFPKNKLKAWTILETRTPELVNSSPKTRAFVDNIADEESQLVTVDVHARCVAENLKRSGDEQPTVHERGYELISRSYVNVAAELGIERPYVLQATCWITWKHLHERG